MTEAEYLWLIARSYVVIRNGLIDTHIAPIYDEMGTLLTNAAGGTFQVPAKRDGEILDFFAPKVEKPSAVEDRPIKRKGIN